MTATVPGLATLAIALGGLLIVAGFRNGGFRLLAVSLILFLAQALLGSHAPGTGEPFETLSRAYSWFAVAGVCAAILYGRGGAKLFLAAAAPLVLGPAALHLAKSMPISTWPLLALLLAAILMAVAVRTASNWLGCLVGREAVGHVLGTWLLRIFDIVGRSLARPFRRNGRHRGRGRPHDHRIDG